MKRNSMFLAVFLAAAVCTGALADVVELKDGTKIEGRIVAKSRKAVMIQTVSGEFREVNPADVKQITEGNVKIQSAPQKAAEPAAAQPAAAPAPAPAGTDARAKLGEELRNIMVYMEQQKLEPWPEREARTQVTEPDANKKPWKIQKKDGSTVYQEETPVDSPDNVKVWVVCKSPVRVIEHNVGMGSYIDKTPAAQWGRMYWHPATKDWGLSHPNYLAFKRNGDQVEGFLGELQRAAGREKDRKAVDYWYKLINCRSGSAKESAASEKIKEASAGLNEVALQIGSALGLGDKVWRIYELSIRIEERITPDATDTERLGWARERQAVCRKIADSFQKGR